jgi:hypothetical protein
MRRIIWLTAGVSLLAAGYFSIVSLNRWEWSRALYFGLIFLIAEIGLATALVLRKLDQIQRPNEASVDPAVLSRLRESRDSTHRFEWLDARNLTNRTNVFITLLIGGGVLLSGLAWLVDRVASITSTPVREQSLAKELASINYPRGGLLVDDMSVLAQSVPGCDDPQLRKLLRRAGHGG